MITTLLYICLGLSVATFVLVYLAILKLIDENKQLYTSLKKDKENLDLTKTL
jgi:hypothetical protein